jgi:argininosuccinate synthase
VQHSIPFSQGWQIYKAKTIWLQQMAIHNLLKNQQSLKSIPLFSMLNHHIPCRQSDNSLFSEKIATFEDDEGAYDQKDAAGFIKLNALRLRLKALK